MEELTIQCNASTNVFGAALLQNGRPIAYASHKPLEMIIKKQLLKTPIRLQGMHLRLQKFHFDISYQQGKLMNLADTLSRAVGSDPSEVMCSKKST